MKAKVWTMVAAGMLSVSLLVAGCNGSETEETGKDPDAVQETETEGTEPAEETEQTNTDVSYEVEQQTFRKDDLCDISYPQITGWKLEDKQEEWNRTFEKYIENAIQDIGENDKVDIYFDVEEQSDELLSMTINYYYEMEGGVHPSSAMQSINVNMQTGEKVTFADLADPEKTAQLLFDGTEGYTIIEPPETTMQDILSYNFIWMEPTEEALTKSLTHFDHDTEDYGENETMGYSFRWNGKVCLIFYLSHAQGDYAVVQLDE